MDGTCNPVKIIPAPMTRPAAARRRCRSHDPEVVEGVKVFKAGNTRTVARGKTGTRPRKTQRHPKTSATIAASAGPMSPGTTQALERIAIMRGFTVSVYHYKRF